MLKIATVCTGIGSPEMAIENLGIEHKIVFGCEIDKYARKSYLANFKTKMMLEDMTKEDWIGDEYYSDLFVGGIPCQAFSLAGKRLGELDPRGLLFYDFYRYVKNQQPPFFIIENVKGLLSDSDGATFQNWINLLGQSENGNSFIFPHEDSLMYNLHWQVLNTKDYGLPQNRERVFLVGIRNDLPNDFNFPKTIPLTKRLKDILEYNVDEKYYLREDVINRLNIQRLSNKNNFEVKDITDMDICPTIISGGTSPKDKQHIIKVGYINQNTQASQVFSTEGVSPTITAGTHGYALGYITEPQIGRSIGRNPDNPKSRESGLPTQQMLEINKDGVSNTLTSVQKDNLVVEPQLTQIAQLDGFESEGRIYDANGLARTIKDGGGGGAKTGWYQVEEKTQYRIRRLTPRECFRLQGYSDEFFEKCQAVNSDTQLYKQAGNTISVPVIQAILKNLLKINTNQICNTHLTASPAPQKTVA